MTHRKIRRPECCDWLVECTYPKPRDDDDDDDMDVGDGGRVFGDWEAGSSMRFVQNVFALLEALTFNRDTRVQMFNAVAVRERCIYADPFSKLHRMWMNRRPCAGGD